MFFCRHQNKLLSQLVFRLDICHKFRQISCDMWHDSLVFHLSNSFWHYFNAYSQMKRFRENHIKMHMYMIYTSRLLNVSYMISQQLLTVVKVEYLFFVWRHGCLRLWPDMAIYCYLHFGRIINNSLAKKIIMFAAVSFGWNYSLNGEYSPQCIFLTFGSDRKSVGRKVNHQHKSYWTSWRLKCIQMHWDIWSLLVWHWFETQRVLSYNMQVIKKDTLWSLCIRKAIFVIGKILGEAETNIYNQCNVIIICLHYYYN